MTQKVLPYVVFILLIGGCNNPDATDVQTLFTQMPSDSTGRPSAVQCSGTDIAGTPATMLGEAQAHLARTMRLVAAAVPAGHPLHQKGDAYMVAVDAAKREADAREGRG